MDWLAAIFTVIFFIIVLCGPLLFLGSVVFNQSQDIYHSVMESGGGGPFIQNVGDSINHILPSGLSFNIEDKVTNLISLLSANITKIFTATISTLLSFLLTLLTLFYFLKDGARWKKAIVLLSPLSDEQDEKIITRLSRAVNGILKGYLLIGLIQGILVGLGLAIFGVPHPALWAVLAGIASFIPSVGTGIISVPAILYLLAMGHTGQAIGYGVWAGVIVGTIDNLLNPIIVGSKLNVPPLLILFSVLGGISLFGPVGLLIGPLTISLLYVLVSIYRESTAVSV